MSTHLRVLVVADLSPLVIEGGGERVLWEQTSRLARRGHRVRIVSRSPAREAPETLERDGVKIRQYSVDRRSPLRFLVSSILRARQAVTRALAEEGADVLHMHQPFSGYGAFRSGGVGALPCLYTFHSPAPLEYVSRSGMTGHHVPGAMGRLIQGMLWGVERACLRRATCIHVLSDFSAGLIWKLYGIGSDRTVKIPGGADIHRFQPAADRGAVRQRLGLAEGSPLLLTVRNLEQRMGLDALINAMPLLRRHFPSVVLLIGGAGSLRNHLESLSLSLGLQDSVRILGYIPEPELPLYYQVADVFVLPTRELEGFGLPTVEALASGTPVLGTAVGATPEILLPLDPSLVFRDTTPQVLAEDLARFLEADRRDPTASQILRGACRRHAELHYSWERSVTRLEQVLEHLASRRAVSPAAPAPCPACGEPSREPDLAYRGTSYVRCTACQTGVAAAPLDLAALRRHYEGQYPLRFPHAEVPDRRAQMFGTVLDRLQALRPPGRLLDVGCGGGHLLAEAGKRGWRGLGTDISHQACLVARGNDAPVAQAEGAALPFREAGVDAVSLINVLDHTPDPLAALREAHRVLLPGGYLVIRVPNAAFHRPCVRFLTSLGPLARWRGWDGYPILHLFALTPGGLRSLADRAGFRVLEIRNSSLATEACLLPEKGRWGTCLRWLQACIVAGAAALQRLSRGCWLLGPSIELYAERPPVGTAGDP